jgi:ribosomal protein S18 acetylase RimI-like enzyme
MRQWKVRPVRGDEFEAWTALFRAYCDFYHWPTSDEHQQTVWHWIASATIEAYVAVPVDEDGTELAPPQGLAHVREWVRPLRGVRCGYLDDLFVAPDARGSGAVDALLAELRRLGCERGWGAVRWTTAPDNDRAIAVYEKIATRTPWLTYDMDPAQP